MCRYGNKGYSREHGGRDVALLLLKKLSEHTEEYDETRTHQHEAKRIQKLYN